MTSNGQERPCSVLWNISKQPGSPSCDRISASKTACHRPLLASPWPQLRFVVHDDYLIVAGFHELQRCLMVVPHGKTRSSEGQDEDENWLQFGREKEAKLNELTHTGPRGIASVCTACSCGFIIRYAGTVVPCPLNLEFGVYVVLCCWGMRGEHCKQIKSHVPRAALLILYIDTAQESGYTPRVDASWAECQSPLQHH